MGTKEKADLAETTARGRVLSPMELGAPGRGVSGVSADERAAQLVGQRLKEERQRLGLSQEQMGERGGVRKQAQLKYEKGERSPSSDYLSGIAEAGANVSYILTGKTIDERKQAFMDRRADLKEATERAQQLTDDLQRGELIRDILLGEKWSKREIIDAAIDRYVAVRIAEQGGPTPTGKRNANG